MIEAWPLHTHFQHWFYLSPRSKRELIKSLITDSGPTSFRSLIANKIDLRFLVRRRHCCVEPFAPFVITVVFWTRNEASFDLSNSKVGWGAVTIRNRTLQGKVDLTVLKHPINHAMPFMNWNWWWAQRETVGKSADLKSPFLLLPCLSALGIVQNWHWRKNNTSSATVD